MFMTAITWSGQATQPVKQETAWLHILQRHVLHFPSPHSLSLSLSGRTDVLKRCPAVHLLTMYGVIHANSLRRNSP